MTSTYVNKAGMRFVRDHLQHIPNLYKEASSTIRHWLQEHGYDYDPDQTDVVVLHYTSTQMAVSQRLSLTEAVISDWQGETDSFWRNLVTGDWAGTFPDINVPLVKALDDKPGLSLVYRTFNGLFSRTNPQHYNSTTHLPINIQPLQRFISELDFHDRFVKKLRDYWQQVKDTYPQSLQISFLAACNKQVEEGSLSDIGRQMAWQAAGVMERTKGLQVRPLNIYHYTATDLIYITDSARQQVLLYLPGNASPFHEFDSMAALQMWCAEQCRDEEKRQRLLQYFDLSDMLDGFWISGLDTALHGLAVYPQTYYRGYQVGLTTDGSWDPVEYVNYKVATYGPLLEGDLFKVIMARQCQRSRDDADFAITTKAQVIKARCRGYLETTLNLMAPLAIVVPEIVPLLAVGGIAQLSLGIDQVVNGKTAQDTPDGASNIVFGLLNAAPLAVEVAGRVRTLFPLKSPKFIMRVNDQLGYPMSPIRPPRLPEDYFSPPAPPVPTDQVIRLPINRLDGTSGVVAALSMDGAEKQAVEVLYEPDNDAFRLKSNENDVAPPRYQLTEGTADLHEVTPAERPVDDDMREATLEKLGVELDLPLEMPPEDDRSQAIALKKQILSIWVGNKEIPAHLIANIEANARMIKQAGYEFKLYLTALDTQLFNSNKAALQKLIDDGLLDLRQLENEDFFKAFIDAPNYAQYRHALTGVGANFSSASDILRYPMLYSEGGIYMDIDDEIIHLKGKPAPFVKLSIAELHTPKEGLVLGTPVSNDLMNMHADYNTNAIGSHEKNPILQQISEEIEERYKSNKTFYDSKPSKGEPGFEQYVQSLSTMTGPGLLNDVISEYMPRMDFLRKVSKLESIPMTTKDYFVSTKLKEEIRLARERDHALTSVIKIGNEHSWANA